MPNMLIHDGVLLEVRDREQITQAIEIMKAAGSFLILTRSSRTVAALSKLVNLTVAVALPDAPSSTVISGFEISQS